MKKIAVVALIIAMLISMAGCFVRTITLHEKRFDTLEELKDAAGDELLYPDNMSPAGFKPAYSEITGYEDDTSWNYRIILRDDAWASNPDDPDWARRNAPAAVPDESAPAIAYIHIYAFVPKSQFIQEGKGTRWPNMWEEIEACERYEQSTGDGTWEMGGMDVRHYAGFAAVPALETDSGEPLPAYTVASAYAGFMRDGLLYFVDMEIFGHPNEAEERMLEKSESMIKAIVVEMIQS